MSILGALTVPAGWRSVPFGRATTRIKEAGRPDLPPLSVFLGAGVVPRNSREDNHNQLGEDLGKYLVVRPGDLVFNKLRTWQGGLGASAHQGIVSPAYFVCRPCPEYDSRFLQYLLLSDAYLQELTRVSKWQPPSQFDIGWEQLRAVPIISPEVSVQRAIADHLDTETARIDALIDKKQRLIELFGEQVEQRVASVVLHLNDGSRSDPSHVPLADEVPTGWAVAPLGSLLELITYGFTNPMPDSDDGPLMVTANDIKDGVVGSESTRRTTWDAFRSLITDKSRPKAGDLLMTKDGSLGRVAVFDGESICINQSVALLRPRPSVDPHLLCELLRARPYNEALLFDAGGTTIKHLYITRVVKLRLALPPQGKATEVLERVQRIRRQGAQITVGLARQIDLLRERRQALITAAVTGELEIPGVAA